MYNHFVSGDEQLVPLVGCAEIAPGDAIGFAQAPLVVIPMSDVSL